MTNTEATTNTQAAAIAQQGAHVAPKKAASTKVASKKKGAPKGPKAARVSACKQAATKATPASRKAAKTAKDAAVPREFSKKAIVLDLLRRKDGATMAEIAKATDWKRHSIRGFISGHLTKKMGLTIESTKNDAGERTYRAAK